MIALIIRYDPGHLQNKPFMFCYFDKLLVYPPQFKMMSGQEIMYNNLNKILSEADEITLLDHPPWSRIVF